MSGVRLLRLLQFGFVGLPVLPCGGRLQVSGVSPLEDCVFVVYRSRTKCGFRPSIRSFSIIDGQ